jgi:hypothetical protein
MYYITKFGQPFKAFKSLANAWLECFDRGFVVQRGRHRPGTTAAQYKHKLDYGVHIIVKEALGPKRLTALGKVRKRGKAKFKPENWIDHL